MQQDSQQLEQLLQDAGDTQDTGCWPFLWRQQLQQESLQEPGELERQLLQGPLQDPFLWRQQLEQESRQEPGELERQLLQMAGGDTPPPAQEWDFILELKAEQQAKQLQQEPLKKTKPPPKKTKQKKTNNKIKKT